MEVDNHMISYITSYMIDLTQSGQFYIITYPEIDISLIIRYLIYLTFLINFYNQSFQSIYIELVASLTCHTSSS